MRRIAILAATALLAACGGDGEDTAGPVSAGSARAETVPEREPAGKRRAGRAGKPGRPGRAGRPGRKRPSRPRIEPVERDEVAERVTAPERGERSAEGEPATDSEPRSPKRRGTRAPRPARVKVVPASEAPPAVRDLIGEAKAAIRDIVALTRAGDPAICTKRFTLNHVQNSTGKQGDAALEQCRGDARRSKGLAVELDEIEGVRVVREDLAYVTYTSSVGPASRTQTVVLVLESGLFKLDGGA